MTTRMITKFEMVELVISRMAIKNGWCLDPNWLLRRDIHALMYVWLNWSDEKVVELYEKSNELSGIIHSAAGRNESIQNEKN